MENIGSIWEYSPYPTPNPGQNLVVEPTLQFL